MKNAGIHQSVCLLLFIIFCCHPIRAMRSPDCLTLENSPTQKMRNLLALAEAAAEHIIALNTPSCYDIASCHSYDKLQLHRKEMIEHNINLHFDPIKWRFKALLNERNKIVDNNNFHALMRLINETNKLGKRLPTIAKEVFHYTSNCDLLRYAQYFFNQKIYEVIQCNNFHVITIATLWADTNLTTAARQEMSLKDREVLENFLAHTGGMWESIAIAHDIIIA